MTLVRVDAQGVEIAVTVVGDGPPVLVLHGFTGSAAAMSDVVDGLADRHRVIAVDMVGHGHSAAPASVAAYSTEAIVQQLARVVEAVAPGPVAVVAYSFGARMALSYACASPRSVSAMVLIGATAGIDDGDAAADRRRSDEALADRIEAEGVPAFVAAWEALPLFASQRRLPAEVQGRIRAGRLANDARGLANSLRGAGTGSMPALWGRLAELDIPTALVVGELDAKYVELGARLAQALPVATLHVVAEAGHAVHIENPDRCSAIVTEALG